MKLTLFQNYLKQQKIDIALFFHPDTSITYFTQKSFSYSLFLVTPVQANLYLTKLDSFPFLLGITPKILSKNWEKEISSKKVKTVGINKSTLSVSQQEKLQKLFSPALFVDVGKKVSEFRQVKTQEEIKKISHACAIASAAFSALIQELSKKKFKTELDIAIFLESFIRRNGAELAFPTIVASGKNSATPHHLTSSEEIKNGFLQLDFGARWQNYCADMSRVLYFGRPSREEIRNYSILLSVQEACIEKAKEGKPFKEINTLARKKLGKLSKYFIHGLGHGIGIEVHEAPIFKNVKAKIKKEIPFTIEPGVYFPGKYGLRIEDTVIWDGKKIEVLTKTPKELIIIL